MNCSRAVKTFWGTLPCLPVEWKGVMSFSGSTGREAGCQGPACLTACLLWCFTLRVLTHLLSCYLTFAFYFFSSFLSISPQSHLLCMLVPLPALFGLFISMTLISMASSHSDKHIRLNIGLCRKTRNCLSCSFPSRMIYAWLKESEQGRWLPWGLKMALQDQRVVSWVTPPKIYEGLRETHWIIGITEPLISGRA